MKPWTKRLLRHPIRELRRRSYYRRVARAVWIIKHHARLLPRPVVSVKQGWDGKRDSAVVYLEVRVPMVLDLTQAAAEGAQTLATTIGLAERAAAFKMIRTLLARFPTEQEEREQREQPG